MTAKGLLGATLASISLWLQTLPVEAASTETLLLEKASFKDCVKIVDSTVASLKANPIQIRTVSHSSAIYKVTFMSVEADLVFLCNDVSEEIEVRRVTPGRWIQAQK